MEYIHSTKKIPVNIDMATLATDNSAIEQLIPSETRCVCGADLDSSCLKLIMKAGILVCIKFVKRGIHVFNKECKDCGHVFRHQDYI